MDLKKKFYRIMFFYGAAVVCFVISCASAIFNHSSHSWITAVSFLVGLCFGLVAIVLLRKFKAEAQKLKEERQAKFAAASAVMETEKAVAAAVDETTAKIMAENEAEGQAGEEMPEPGEEAAGNGEE